MNAPLFTVTITTYNRSDLLPRAMDSVLAQTFRDFELIVVDDGSTDDTESVVAGYDDPRVRYVFQENAGLSAARNTGVANSNGTYVTFLDDDDEALSGWLQGFSTLIDESSPGVLTCAMLYVDLQGSPIQTLLPRPMERRLPGAKGLFRTGAYSVRKDVFQSLAGYAVGARRSQNTEFSMRLVAACADNGWSIASTDEVLVRAYRHAPQSGFFEGKLVGAEYILDTHVDLFEKDPRKHSTYLSVAGVNAARVGEFKKARHYFRRALAVRPAAWRSALNLLIASCPPVARRFWASRKRRRLEKSAHTSYQP